MTGMLSDDIKRRSDNPEQDLCDDKQNDKRDRVVISRLHVSFNKRQSRLPAGKIRRGYKAQMRGQIFVKSAANAIERMKLVKYINWRINPLFNPSNVPIKSRTKMMISIIWCSFLFFKLPLQYFIFFLQFHIIMHDIDRSQYSELIYIKIWIFLVDFSHFIINHSGHMAHVRFAFFPDNGEVLAVNVYCRFGFLPSDNVSPPFRENPSSYHTTIIV